MFLWQCGQLPRAAWCAGKAWHLPQPHWDAEPVATKPGLGVYVVSASVGSYQGHLVVLVLSIALTMLQLCITSSDPTSLSQHHLSATFLALAAVCCSASEQAATSKRRFSLSPFSSHSPSIPPLLLLPQPWCSLTGAIYKPV